jgi:hypothetical protein
LIPGQREENGYVSGEYKNKLRETLNKKESLTRELSFRRSLKNKDRELKLKLKMRIGKSLKLMV